MKNEILKLINELEVEKEKSGRFIAVHQYCRAPFLDVENQIVYDFSFFIRKLKSLLNAGKTTVVSGDISDLFPQNSFAFRRKIVTKRKESIKGILEELECRSRQHAVRAVENYKNGNAILAAKFWAREDECNLIISKLKLLLNEKNR